MPQLTKVGVFRMKVFSILKNVISLKFNLRFTRKRRCALTLMEMIIVMILIATITGSIAVSYNSSLNKGRTFATERKIERLKAIIHVYMAEHPDYVSQSSGQEPNWEQVINETGLGTSKAEDLLKDAWGNKLTISYKPNPSDGTFALDVTSPRLQNVTAR
jgi:type II secretory pathway pseudopilin PulG